MGKVKTARRNPPLKVEELEAAYVGQRLRHRGQEMTLNRGGRHKVAVSDAGVGYRLTVVGDEVHVEMLGILM